MDSSSLDSGSGTNDNNQQQQQAAMVLMQLQAVVEAQKASMQILNKCFGRCVDTPGNELSRTQQQCLWNCTQRLFDTETFIAKRLTGMSQQKH